MAAQPHTPLPLSAAAAAQLAARPQHPTAHLVYVCECAGVCAVCVCSILAAIIGARVKSSSERERDSTIRSTTPRNLPYRISDADPAMYVPPPPPRPAAPLKHPRFSHLYGPWAIDKLSHALLRALSLRLRLSLSLSIDLVLYYNKP